MIQAELVMPYTHGVQGGGEVQLRESARHLNALPGIEVRVGYSPSYRDRFAILHLFGMDVGFAAIARTARGLGRPVIITPIWVTQHPDWKWRVLGMVDRLVPVPTVYSYKCEILRQASVVIASSRSEAASLRAIFPKLSASFQEVPIGLDGIRFSQADRNLFRQQYGLRQYVLQVSRISPVKGQLDLLKAAESLRLPVVFIGGYDGYDRNYFAEFVSRVRLSPHAHYVGELRSDSELLASAYAGATVHVLPSLRDGPGMVSLEAAAAGTRVVSSRNQVIEEYLGDRIDYCVPGHPESIRAAIEQAVALQNPKDLQSHVLQHFSWKSVALQLAACYRQVQSDVSGSEGQAGTCRTV